MKLSELIKRDESKITPENLEEFRRAWAKETGGMPRNSDIWPHLTDADLIRSFRTREVHFLWLLLDRQ